jgi:hypothetical protein
VCVCVYVCMCVRYVCVRYVCVCVYVCMCECVMYVYVIYTHLRACPSRACVEAVRGRLVGPQWRWWRWSGRGRGRSGAQRRVHMYRIDRRC